MAQSVGVRRSLFSTHLRTPTISLVFLVVVAMKTTLLLLSLFVFVSLHNYVSATSTTESRRRNRSNNRNPTPKQMKEASVVASSSSSSSSSASTKSLVGTSTVSSTTTAPQQQATTTTTTTTTIQTPPPPPPSTPPLSLPRDMTRFYSALVAGVGSGALASVICAPLDLIRTRLQVWQQVTHNNHNNINNNNVRPPNTATMIPQMLRDIIRRDGLVGCFRGLGATMVTVPAFWGVYWPIYDDCKRRWSHEYPTYNPMWIHMGAAVTAGIVSDVICNPMFVVRTRLQTEALHNLAEGQSQKLSMIQTAAALYKEGGGPFIFWRGMTANLLGLSHVGVQFPVYEQLKKVFRGAHKQHETALDLLLASGLSKMTACVLTYPHEVIRSRMMDARTRVGFVQTCKRIYAGEGMAGFYAGLPITLIRVIPNTCITFVTYELFLRWAREKLQERQNKG